MRRFPRALRGRGVLLVLAALSSLLVFGGTAVALTGDDTPTLYPGLKSPLEGADDESEAELIALDRATTSSMLAGDNPLDIGQAAQLRVVGQGVGKKLGLAKGSDPSTFSGS